MLVLSTQKLKEQDILLIYCASFISLLLKEGHTLHRGPDRVGWGGRSHVACLNFKMSCVGVYKCFTPLSEIERKFFVFVGIVEKGKSDAY